MTSLTIRPFGADDYDAIAHVINHTNPNFPATAAGLKSDDERRPALYKHGCWLAEQAGEVVGFVWYIQHPDAYDPKVVHTAVRVLPSHQGQGIGQALYATLESAMLAEGITTLRGMTKSDLPRSVAFATHAGFTEYGRRIETALDLTTFDPAPFGGILEELSAKGIQIRPYSELKDDPSLAQKIYVLQTTTEADVPLPMPYTPPPFDEYTRNVLEEARMPHEGIFLALMGDEVVGMTSHFVVSDTHINIDYTGVARAWRGHGIAMGLKVAGAMFAHARSAETLFTTNDPDNPAIIGVNKRLGFVPRPALIMLIKTIG